MDETGMVFALGNEAADKMREPHVIKKETPDDGRRHKKAVFVE